MEKKDRERLKNQGWEGGLRFLSSSDFGRAVIEAGNLKIKFKTVPEDNAIFFKTIKEAQKIRRQSPFLGQVQEI